jgi:RNA polymerase sigma factor (sigma-70 family)
MSEKTELQLLGDETRPYFERYWKIIEPFQHELWNYCKKITGNPWDGEDLYQDTLLKMFTSLSSLSHREQPIHPRSFLFRVATNHWIDICRKRKVKTEDWSDNLLLASTSDSTASMEIEGAFETLLKYLPPRQTVVLVLVDAFQFTAREAAEVIGTTEGAIHATLHRARANLRKLADKESNPYEQKSATESSVHPTLLNRYVSCFNKRDFQGIADLLAEDAVYSFVAQGSKEYGKNSIMTRSHNPAHYERRDLRAFVHQLWGKQAIIFYQLSEQGDPIALNEVLTIESEDNHIVSMKGYFFCPQFMEIASRELGVPRESWQWV